MNQLFYEAILKEKEREVAKYVEYNRIKRLYRDSARSQPESTGQDKNVISSWLLRVAKRLKGVLLSTIRAASKSKIDFEETLDQSWLYNQEEASKERK